MDFDRTLPETQAQLPALPKSGGPVTTVANDYINVSRPKPELRERPLPGDVGITLGHNGNMVYTDPYNAINFVRDGLAQHAEYGPPESLPSRETVVGRSDIGSDNPIMDNMADARFAASLPPPQAPKFLQAQQMNFPTRTVTIAHPVTGNQVQTTPEAAQQLITAGHAVPVPNG